MSLASLFFGRSGSKGTTVDWLCKGFDSSILCLVAIVYSFVYFLTEYTNTWMHCVCHWTERLFVFTSVRCEIEHWSPGLQLPQILEDKSALSWNAPLLGCSLHHHFYYNGKVPRLIWESSGWRNEWKGSSLMQSVATVTCKSLILESGGWIQVCYVTISPRLTPQAKANSLWSGSDQTHAVHV